MPRQAQQQLNQQSNQAFSVHVDQVETNQQQVASIQLPRLNTQGRRRPLGDITNTLNSRSN